MMFKAVMSLHPVLLKIGPISFYSWGFMLALGTLAGAAVASRAARTRGIQPQDVFDFTVWALIAGVLGSRLLYVALNYSEYKGNLQAIFSINEGGLALHGGLLAGLIVGVIFTRRRHVSFYSMADCVAPGLAIGIAVARIGCFLNGCCYGTLTNVSWATLTRYAEGLRHPTQLYESIGGVGLFVVLSYLSRRINKPGGLFIAFVGLYSVLRFTVEFFRGDSVHVGVLTQAQIASIFIIAGCICAWVYSSHYFRKISTIHGQSCGQDESLDLPDQH